MRLRRANLPMRNLVAQQRAASHCDLRLLMLQLQTFGGEPCEDLLQSGLVTLKSSLATTMSSM